MGVYERARDELLALTPEELADLLHGKALEPPEPEDESPDASTGGTP
ncbi:MAG: hypothetical protein ACRDQX_10970 [Pseudonocardiaceae bacterium]